METTYDYTAIANALRTQKQLDRDGDEVGVSRQAADEAATILEELARATPCREAAKELLEALGQAAEWFQQYGDGHIQKGDIDKAKRNHDRAEFCRAAIAKATGGANV